MVGLGEGENYVASDIPAILADTRQMIFLEEGEMVDGHARRASTITDFEGKPHDARAEDDHVVGGAGREGRLQALHAQGDPRAAARGRGHARGRVDLEHDDVIARRRRPRRRRTIKRIIFIACGTSYHASLVGEFLVEALARIPVEVELAREFRYRDPIVGPGDLVVAVSQSGETLDTLAAIREAKKKGAQVLAISNVLERRSRALADHAFYTHAGPEIGVASTKAFTTQLVALALLAIYLGRRTGTLHDGARARAARRAASQLPNKMRDVVEQRRAAPGRSRAATATRSGFLFLGRGAQYPIALEGALKLKEISYIHAEGYAAGEMKHGPIALIDEHLPVVVLVPRGPSYEKTMSNLAEVRAREGKVIAIATARRQRDRRPRRRRRPRPRHRARAAADPDRAAAAAARRTTSPTSRAPTSTSRATSRSPSPSSECRKRRS